MVVVVAVVVDTAPITVITVVLVDRKLLVVCTWAGTSVDVDVDTAVLVLVRVAGVAIIVLVGPWTTVLVTAFGVMYTFLSQATD